MSFESYQSVEIKEYSKDLKRTERKACEYHYEIYSEYEAYTNSKRDYTTY